MKCGPKFDEEEKLKMVSIDNSFKEVYSKETVRKRGLNWASIVYLFAFKIKDLGSVRILLGMIHYREIY